jgi:8-oxo-dGTP pyrophosphatase MutT (NUDIX family)
MASVGHGHYVVLVIHVGGTKLSDVKLVLQREPRTGKTWFPAGSILPNEEHVDAAVREIHEETDLTLTSDDLTLLSDAHVRVAILQGRQLVYVYSASVHRSSVFLLRAIYVQMLRLSRLLHHSRQLIRMVLTSSRNQLTLTV